ncbi:hypothetical protein MUO32_26255 [Shinella sp. CPCC 101442]|uniref:hypothetical protein n=1 Tax=Shinella sp. CPCC 101442 TaxID=2932265 RepID=UPI00215343E4|nr:hypothetical protein [Shinella sp. CPCC 101442]MCR6502534.1 hypothetical protein [Shinella sp. CPCC 101442]
MVDQLQYRPFDYDDWGMIRNGDGSMHATVRRPEAFEGEFDQHRTEQTDPFADLARRIIFFDQLEQENAELRTGIKRLSDEEELCAETTGNDPFSMVYLAAKLAKAEAEVKALQIDASNHAADAETVRRERDALILAKGFEKIGYVTAGELAHLRLGVSCIDLFGEIAPAGFEMVPVFVPAALNANGPASVGALPDRGSISHRDMDTEMNEATNTTAMKAAPDVCGGVNQ